MKRKHIVLFTIITLVCVAALVLFQAFGDPSFLGTGNPPAEQGGPAGPVPENGK